MKKTSEISPFGLRMDPPLKQALEETARANRRSLNSELVIRLERSLKEDGARESKVA